MSFWAIAALMCAACYLIGSVPFGLLAGRLRGLDIRTRGSRNIGATNVARVLGRKWGIAVFVLDVVKGLIPTLACGSVVASASWMGEGQLWPRNILWLAAAMCCVLGHNYSVYLGFKGGKGVATSMGVVLGVYPHLTVPGLIAFGVWCVVTLGTRYVSLGSIAAAVTFPILVVVYAVCQGYNQLLEGWPFLGFSVLAAGLVVYRHRENVGRLRAGTESRIGGGA
jgi:glycerol-3-phosphate acyltransferase PlsY